MKILFLFIPFVLYMNVSVRAQNNINCNSKGLNARLDGIFAKLYTYGNSGRRFPHNHNEAEGYCRETLDLLQTAELFITNCLKEYPKRLLSIMVKTVRTQSKTLCARKDSRRMRDLFTAAPCTNGARNEYQKCLNTAIDELTATKTVDDRLKLPILCCGFHKMAKCFRDESIKVRNCNEEKIETSLRFLDSVQGNMVSVLCFRYDDLSDTCDKVVYPQTYNKRKYKSLVLPMIQVLDSVKDERNLK